MVELITIPSHHIDAAWKAGACALAKACDLSGGEITGDQLKFILARGERILVRMDRDKAPVGWGVVRVDQLPNVRVLMVTDMVAEGANFPEFFDKLKELAASCGCSKVRCAADDVRERLYRAKVGFKRVYAILEVDV
jgi:hypothetical protein